MALPNMPAARMAARRGAPLGSWREFRRCRAEPDGRYEVYFRYDDELEYWAKANNFTTEVEQYSGTKVYGFPVVLSALFDAGGMLVGLRIVSDPRDPSRRREEAYALRNFITARFGRDGWDCIDHPPAEGETPVLRTFIKQDCRKTIDGVGVADTADALSAKKGPEPSTTPAPTGRPKASSKATCVSS